jgi:integrase
MPKLRLTKTNIDRVAKPGGKSDVLYWDTNGFGLRVNPSGKATFIYQGRIDGTTTDVRVTIGTYGAWEIEQARKQADELRHQCEAGIDPRAAKKQKQGEQVTLGDICTAYLNRPKAMKQTTKDWFTYYVDRVFEDWKDKPVTSITADMVRKRHAKLLAGGLHGKKGAPGTANSAVTVLGILLRFAGRQHKRADGSPLVQLDMKEVMADSWADEGDRTDRYIPYDRAGRVWLALTEARAKPTSHDARSGLDLAAFLLLTGSRRLEAAGLEWSRVHLDDEKPENSYWHLVDRKVGKPIRLPLSRQAADILRERKKLAEKDETDSPYVFTTLRGKTGHLRDSRASLELVSAAAGQHLSSHDLRRSFTGIAFHMCRVEKFRCDLLIGHAVRDDVTATNYLDTSDMRWLWADAQKVADWIEAEADLAAAKAKGENVVELRA